MKISTANLQMASAHVASQRHEVSESLRLWVGKERAESESPSVAPPPSEDPVHISDAGKSVQSGEAKALDDASEAIEKDPKLRLIKAVVEFMTGMKIRLFDARQLHADPPPPPQDDSTGQATAQGQATAGYGVEYERREFYSETEQMSFSASGVVHTADGREISFELSLAMSRSYQEESQTSLRLGDAVRKKDPLVINFSGTAAQLTDTRFSFDLDADGQADQINFVEPGSGFLVLDRNHDGKVNDGSELFGPATGDGFSELTRLDGDKNGWLDENDKDYQTLRLWTMDASGQEHLRPLPEANVGAISLARVSTPFDLKGEGNSTQGQIKSSGVFLQEDGEAGTIQQIDLSI